jgi:hypothetical protein
LWALLDRIEFLEAVLGAGLRLVHCLVLEVAPVGSEVGSRVHIKEVADIADAIIACDFEEVVHDHRVIGRAEKCRLSKGGFLIEVKLYDPIESDFGEEFVAEGA